MTSAASAKCWQMQDAARAICVFHAESAAADGIGVKHDGYPRYCPRCGRKIAKVTILRSRTTGELVRCGECIYFGRCPMRKGDGSGYCWQAKRREGRHGDEG